MNIVISSGHAKYVRGASGSPVPPQLDEVDEARRVVEAVADYLGDIGVGVKTFHDDTSHSQNENLNTIVNYHNAQTRDLDVSVHFNAYDGSAHGVECLYVTQQSLATTVANKIAAAGGFTNRGPKKRTDLFFLNSTEEPAVLIETCFCDNTGDSNAYRAKFDEICRAIAEALSGQSIGERPPIEPEEPPPTEPPSEPSGRNIVDFTVAAAGEVIVEVNGSEILVGSDRRTKNRLVITMDREADVVVTVNGQEFHNWPGAAVEEAPAIPSNQQGITATVFGGPSDPNYSAYDGSLFLNDTDSYVALPAKFKGERPQVVVRNVATGKSAAAEIMDVGPWMTDDFYWETGTRPIAEQCYQTGKPLPRGPHAGKVPTNDAGIDLSPALAQTIGISGKGKVDWEFVDGTV